MRLIAVGALAAAAIAAAGGASAAAAPATASAELTLTRTSEGREPRTVTLRCGPDGGDHPYAADACDALWAADGDFDRLTGATPPEQCPLQSAPVSVRAEGTWTDHPVDVAKDYLNPCFLDADAGVVFRF
ncbi:SSI family serine proteinase inhibitor [Phytomonospora endophytica]|uniref:Subtilisin inhibitor domain-containing protein n=1 Tax=Phytomonospora endophytica TaxID=714109 RepID=A0A841FI07_9ACTN|nr:SSI family serine proteinase inhibitor [Phytomonospora endophytica]MBB6035494.1 hypothetical protein [Phytomonospora endophytica]GIG63753.1 hypothetical protein Pen01_00480 [Phytomonospora endophytica]